MCPTEFGGGGREKECVCFLEKIGTEGEDDTVTFSLCGNHGMGGGSL